MFTHLFELFSGMIDKIPTKGVLSAVEFEAQMLQKDLANKRTLPIDDTRSILAFSRFLDSILDGVEPERGRLPPRHLNFYRRTIKRLVEAGELPGSAEERFDAAFSSSLAMAPG